MKLSNWKIVQKLLLVVGAMGLIIATISAISVLKIDTLAENTGRVDATGSEALRGVRLSRNVLAISAAGYRIAVDPSAETIKRVLEDVEVQRKELETRFAQLKQTANAEQMPLLVAAEKAYQAYLPEFNSVIEKARKLGSQVNLDEAQSQIVQEARASRQAAEEAMQAMSAFNQYSDKHAAQVSKESAEVAASARTLMITLAAAGTIGGILLGYLLAVFGIGRPVAASVDCLRKLSTGDLAVQIFGVGRKDEIGEIADAMNVFKQNMLRTQQLEAEAKEAEARAAEERKAAMNKMADEFEADVMEVVNALSSAATELESAAQSMTATAEETSRQAMTVAAASDQASTNVQTVATAGEELSSSIAEIGRQVGHSAKIAGQAVEDATRTDQKVQGLAEAAQKIGEVIKLINDIASQTNLLALNATIEAARAGEAGKGFAVVAAEVKNLANQTAKATGEIAGQINAIQDATQDSVEAIQLIGKTIGEINEIATTIASAVEQQNAATQEIARNVQQAALGTSEVSSNIGEVTKAAGATGGAATQVLASSQQLSEQSEVLRSKVNHFVMTVRAA